MSDKIYDLQISKKFLKEMYKLTKMSIKVYLSLSFLQYKRGSNFKASHTEISINVFDDDDYGWSAEWFGIRTDQTQYFKAFKQLELYGLIKRYKSKTPNGANNVNRYTVY